MTESRPSSASVSAPAGDIVKTQAVSPRLLFAESRLSEIRDKRERYRWAQLGFLHAKQLASFVHEPTEAGGDDGWVMPAMANPGMRGRHLLACSFAATLVGRLENDRAWLRHAWALMRRGLYDQQGRWWQPMSLRVAFAVDGFWHALDADERDEIATLLRSALANARNATGGGNKGAGHRKAMIAVAACTGESALIDEALHDPHCGAYEILDKQLASDALWYETAPSYHCYALLQFMELTWLCDMLGVRLETWFRQRLHAGMRATFGLLDSARRLPDTGDTWRPVLGFQANPTGPLCSTRTGLELMARLFDDPWAGWALRHTPRDTIDSLAYGLAELPCEAPPAHSRLFEVSGVAALRSPADEAFWNGDGFTAYLRFGPDGGWHGHRDALALELRALGRHIIADRGRAARYADISHERWYRTTLAHSTVVVDRKNQTRHSAGHCTLYWARPHVSATAARCPGAYPDVDYRRLVLLTDRYLIDRFNVSAETAHTYHYVLHTDGKPCTHATSKPADGIGVGDGYGFLAELHTTHHDAADALCIEHGQWSGDRFRAHGTGVQVTKLQPAESRLITANVPAAENDGFGQCIVLERAGKDTCFTTLIEPYRKAPRVVIEEASIDEDRYALMLAHETGHDVVCVTDRETCRQVIGDVVFEGRVLFVRRDAAGGIVRLHAHQAKRLWVGEQCILDAAAARDMDMPDPK